MEKISFTNYLESKSEVDKNYRRTLIKELYDIYQGPKERDKRKKENWKRYIQFLRERKQANSVENQKAFKNSRQYLRELTGRHFSIRLATIDTRDLCWCISQIKSGRSFGWLFWSISNRALKP